MKEHKIIKFRYFLTNSEVVRQMTAMGTRVIDPETILDIQDCVYLGFQQVSTELPKFFTNQIVR